MSRSERIRLSAVVFVVLFTQLLVYPGVEKLVAALGAAPTIDAGTAFLAVQLAAFVLFSTVWGAVSDRAGRRTPELLVPYVFGFTDRFTAGFFGLVGTFYLGETFDLDPAAIGLVLACFFAPFALLQYPLGALSDRVGRVVPVVAGSVGYGLAIVGVGLAPTAAVAAAGMVVVGILGALVAPATMALVTDMAAAGERGAAMGGFNVFGSLGFLGGILVGGAVADRLGFLAAFLVAGGLEAVVVVAALPVLVRVVPDPTAIFGGA